MTTRKVKQYGHSKLMYVEGLYHLEGDDVLLFYRYPGGDYDIPSDETSMFGALYDLANVHDEVQKGDLFETPFGNFRCVGAGVEPA